MAQPYPNTGGHKAMMISRVRREKRMFLAARLLGIFSIVTTWQSGYQMAKRTKSIRKRAYE
jgi:hypothetical protein